jgi:hypothetical protein
MTKFVFFKEPTVSLIFLNMAKMNEEIIKRNKNSTNFCVSKVSFEYREISPELAEAKHTRIMRMFAEALERERKNAFEEQVGEEA